MLKCEKIVKTYYDALEEGKILGRRCLSCGHIEFPPYLACNQCGALDTEWVEMSGKGMCTQIIPPSAMFFEPPYHENVGDYFIIEVIPEGAHPLGSTLIHVEPARADELRAKLPLPVKAVIIQEDGYKNVVWELDE